MKNWAQKYVIFKTLRYVLAGVVAGGFGCGQHGIPGVYASVDENLCFIHWATKCMAGRTYAGHYWYPQCDNWIVEYLNSGKYSARAMELEKSCHHRTPFDAVVDILPDESEKCSEWEWDGYTCVNRDLCFLCKEDDENCSKERFELGGNPEEATCDDKDQICCFLDDKFEPGIN